MAIARLTRRVAPLGYLAWYYASSLLGRKRPLLGGIKLTHDCNLACVHCPFRQRKGSALSYSQVQSSMDTLYEWGVRIVILEGGEPFLWRDGAHDLRDVVAEAKKRFYCVGVTTNGSYPIEVDADVVWVSMDGLRETHDRIRGKSFDRLVSNITASSHNKILAHVTINALNWREIPELVSFLAPMVWGITVQFHYPYDELDAGLLLPIEARHRVLENLIEMKQQGLPLANSVACLRALRDNTWRCRPWMIASVDPDGTMTHGCYVQNRGDIACDACGFSAHTEISLAYNGVLEAILVGNRIFFSKS
jgi:MoaA/NifB/PqqE/SkfB family radical SAM enzyme